MPTSGPRFHPAPDEAIFGCGRRLARGTGGSAAASIKRELRFDWRKNRVIGGWSRLRLLLRWVLNALALLGIAYVAPSLGILRGFYVNGCEAAAFAVLILSLLNLTVKPIIKLLALPITCLTFGLFTLVINAVMMLLTSELVPGFRVGGFLNALVASVIYAVASALLNAIFNKDD
jgi:putative membrane protein